MPGDVVLNDVVPVFARGWGSWHVSIGRRALAKDDLAAAYDKSAASWDATLDRHGFDAGYAGLMRTVRRQPRYALPGRKLDVLDAGIGTGAMASAFADMARRPLRLVGIDLSDAMLRRAAQRLGGRHIDLSLQRADLSALPFDDARFDVVLAAHVIEHLPDTQAALAELTRVLKPGGLLICAITRQSPVGAWVQLMWRTHRVAIPTARRWLSQGGLQAVRAVPFGRGLAARRFSVGYVGRKAAPRDADVTDRTLGTVL